MKTLAIILVLAASYLAALGQGQVQFQNYVPSTTPAIDAPVYLYHMGGARPDYSNPLWRVALLGGPTTATPASSTNVGTLSQLYHPTITSLTWFNFGMGTNAGYADVRTNAARVVPGVDWGGTALVQVVAWEGNYYDWADAYSWAVSGGPYVLIGMSNPLTLRLPNGPTDGNLTFLWGLNSFALGWAGGPSFWSYTGPADQTVSAGDPVTLAVSVDAWPVPDFQWYFNGVALAGANSSCLQIPSAQPTDAGSYYAILTDPMFLLWTYTTGVATVTVRVPPGIALQPQSQTAVAGSGTVFRVSATGDAPLGCQWFFNGSTPLGTGTSLKLTALESRNIGAYTVVVTNVWGAVTSTPAMLNVIAPVDTTRALGVVGTAQNGTAMNLETARQLSGAPSWLPLVENVMAGTNTSQVYVDWPMQPAPDFLRLYRAWQTNGVNQPPMLSIHLVSGITLTGTAGSSVRIDYINQIGPTDAWVTLATVPLTNTSQLYFDTSAIGPPPRLYRLVSPP
ncbi:MAG TPA: immunoglobulin domain-containing protein [Verrucomicrobiae bacterium]